MHKFTDERKQAQYDRIVSGDYWVETSLVIGKEGHLITEKREDILIGGYTIAVSRGGGDSGFRETILHSVKITGGMFAHDYPEVGCCVASEIDIEMNAPTGDIPRMAQMIPYVRVYNDEEKSEWIQKGVFYVDTRENLDNGSGQPRLRLHGYDAMLKSEQDYPKSEADWPRKDIEVVEEIAAAMGVNVDYRTREIITNGYDIQYPALYTCREVLGYIAAAYCGSFIMSEDGELRLCQLYGIPKDDRVLIDQLGNAIVIGQDRIRV